MTPFQKAARAAAKHLAKTDPALGAIIERVGPVTLEPHPDHTPFTMLVRAVAHQQLSGKAAETILGRFHALFPNSAFPTPAQVLKMSEDAIRSVGFSRPKVSYIRDIAANALSGIVPSVAEVHSLTDDELIERLTSIKGVGRWTVEMLLIFKLGRLDVLPASDLGIQKGFAITYRKRKLPKPEAILKHGELWRPYRTVASWYLWRAVDLPKPGAI